MLASHKCVFAWTTCAHPTESAHRSVAKWKDNKLKVPRSSHIWPVHRCIHSNPSGQFDTTSESRALFWRSKARLIFPVKCPCKQINFVRQPSGNSDALKTARLAHYNAHSRCFCMYVTMCEVLQSGGSVFLEQLKWWRGFSDFINCGCRWTMRVTAGFRYVITLVGGFTWTWKWKPVCSVGLWGLSFRACTQHRHARHTKDFMQGKVTVPHCSSLKTHDFALRSFHVFFTWDEHYHSCTPRVYHIHLTNTGYLIKWPVSVHCFESFHGLQPVCPFSSVCRSLVIIFFFPSGPSSVLCPLELLVPVWKSQ